MSTSIGDTVRRLRLEAGLTQKELADRIGFQRSWVANIEQGIDRNLTFNRVEVLAAALGTTAHEMMGGDQTRLAYLRGRLDQARESAEELIVSIDEIKTLLDQSPQPGLAVGG